MAKLIFSAITSLDGYIEDAAGTIQWGAPDEDVISFINHLERPIGTYLYGRRMYETMSFWETAHEIPDMSAGDRDFTELWLAADKVVFSRTLESVSTSRTRLEREFDPKAIEAMKSSMERDITISGPALAAHAIAAGLVDEYQFYVSPIALGGGKPALPSGVRLDLELLSERHFRSGTVYLRYGSRTDR
jgi:dihydrofolate reductase